VATVKPTGKALRRPKLGRFTGVVIAAVLLSAAAVRADVYFYKDADGVFHFTNVPGPRTAPFVADKPFPHGPLSDRPLRTLDRNMSPISASSYDDIINEYAERFDVEPALVKAVIHAESGFNRLAVSPKGARGLMQLMPKTARHHGVRNAYDPRENIKGGVQHLRMLMDHYGNNLPHVLAAYNAGEDPVERYRGIPPYEETRTYVSRVLRYRQQYLKKERLAQVAANS
jgi:hypothetical protein